MLDITGFFSQAISQSASDIHLVGGEIPELRIEGELAPLAAKPLNNKDLVSAINGLLTKDQQKKIRQ